jgi:hypothetical protein
MSAITIEGPVLEQLRSRSSGTTLCDSLGNSVGVVVSQDDYLKLLYTQAKERYTDEEIEEMRRRPPEGISTTELRKRLRLPCPTK